MALFGRNKEKEISVNFMHSDGLPYYGQNLAVSATVTPTSVVFRPRIGKKPEPVILPREKILDVAIASEDQILARDKSVLGRAAVGALLAGPFGALLGGMSGIGQKHTKEHRRFVIITYGEDQAIALEIVGASIGWPAFVTALRPELPEGPITL